MQEMTPSTHQDMLISSVDARQRDELVEDSSRKSRHELHRKSIARAV